MLDSLTESHGLICRHLSYHGTIEFQKNVSLITSTSKCLPTVAKELLMLELLDCRRLSRSLKIVNIESI